MTEDRSTGGLALPAVPPASDHEHPAGFRPTGCSVALSNLKLPPLGIPPPSGGGGCQCGIADETLRPASKPGLPDGPCTAHRLSAHRRTLLRRSLRAGCAVTLLLPERWVVLCFFQYYLSCQLLGLNTDAASGGAGYFTL